MARAANGIDALRQIDEHAPDLVFLDIRMPGLSGLGVAERLAAGVAPPHIVFITAHQQYAVDAFEHAAVDYVLKPVTQERLAKTVARAREALTQAPAALPAETLRSLIMQLAAPAPAPEALQWVRAAQGDETRLIAVDEIIYFQSDDKHTIVYLQDEQCLIRTPLSRLREQLDEARFWQIHRGIIVAARHVAGTDTDFRGRLQLRLKGRPEQLTVSRNYVDRFRKM